MPSPLNSKSTMNIEVLRIGQRVVRDERVTTHVALVARAFGASKIMMEDMFPELKKTVDNINSRWGGNFKLEFIKDWKDVLKTRKRQGYTVVHLTMYGQNANEIIDTIKNDLSHTLVVIGAGKVPIEVYKLADYNVSITNQPHSEIGALAVFLDKIYDGDTDYKFQNTGKFEIVPSNSGKKVREKQLNKYRTLEQMEHDF